MLTDVVKAPDLSTIFNAISRHTIYLMPRQDALIVMMGWRDASEGWRYIGTPAPVGTIARHQNAITGDFDPFESDHWGLWQRVKHEALN